MHLYHWLYKASTNVSFHSNVEVLIASTVPNFRWLEVIECHNASIIYSLKDDVLIKQIRAERDRNIMSAWEAISSTMTQFLLRNKILHCFYVNLVTKQTLAFNIKSLKNRSTLNLFTFLR